MAVLCTDGRLYLFHAKTLKLKKTFNESISAFLKQQQGEIDFLKVAASDLERRVTCEESCLAAWQKGEMLPQVSFD
jgi:hypothetical protein